MPKKSRSDEEKDLSRMGKLESKIDPAIVDAMRGMSNEELDARIVTLAKHEKEIDDALNEDEDIVETKNKLKELKAPHTDARKGVKNQRTFALLLLEERGKS
jgi:hypothetical protein